MANIQCDIELFSTKHYLKVEIQLITEVSINIWILQVYKVLKMFARSDSYPLPQISHFSHVFLLLSVM